MKNLRDFYTEHVGKGSDKWDLYLNRYNEILADLREKPITLLEVGIQNGGSLEIWAKYFSNAQHLIGCDIDQRCECLKYEDGRVSLVIGDINKEDTLGKVLNISSKFDLIIDDGSHASSDIIKSFVNLFPCVKDDGIYIVEDLHCSYWAHYEGGLFYPNSSMNFLKALADVINHQHWGNGYSRGKILESFCSMGGGILSEDELSKIHSIQFFNSICVIKKKAADNNVLNTRVISGTEFNVCEMVQINSCSRITEASELTNKWANIQKTTEEYEEEKKQLIEENTELFGEKTQLSEEKIRNLEEKKQLSEEIARLSDQVESLKSNNWTLEDKIKALGAVVDEKSIHLERITASLSWKITKPLRSLHSCLRKMMSP
jgi:hypothetical protein